MRYLKFILSIIIMVFVIVLIIENHETLSETVRFRFKMFSFERYTVDIYLYYLVAVPFLLGVIITGIFGMVERYRLHKQIKDLLKTNRNKDKELNSLRNLPITTDNMGPGDIDDMMK